MSYLKICKTKTSKLRKKIGCQEFTTACYDAIHEVIISTNTLDEN